MITELTSTPLARPVFSIGLRLTPIQLRGHLAVRDQLIGHLAGQVAGDRKAQAAAAAQFVHADDLAGEVDQRAAAVAGVDSRVVLDPRREQAGPLPAFQLHVLDRPRRMPPAKTRLGLETMPRVTDRDRANGDPMAIT